jgi:hypothetical protein
MSRSSAWLVMTLGFVGLGSSLAACDDKGSSTCKDCCSEVLGFASSNIHYDYDQNDLAALAVGTWRASLMPPAGDSTIVVNPISKTDPSVGAYRRGRSGAAAQCANVKIESSLDVSSQDPEFTGHYPALLTGGATLEVELGEDGQQRRCAKAGYYSNSDKYELEFYFCDDSTLWSFREPKGKKGTPPFEQVGHRER